MPIHFKRRFRTYMLAGILALIPLTFTYLILRYLFGMFDNLLMPLVVRLLILGGLHIEPNARIPGFGLLATFLLVLAVGLMTHNYLGRKLLALGERLLQRIPLVSGIYKASRQLVDAFSLPGKKAFRGVVLVEFPRPGMYVMGFLTNDTPQRFPGIEGELRYIFIPTTPNPTSGYLVLARESDFTLVPLSVEDGIKVIVSGGILAPPIIPHSGAAGAGIPGELIRREGTPPEPPGRLS